MNGAKNVHCLAIGPKRRFRWETEITRDSNFKRLINDNETHEENAPVSTNTRHQYV